MKKVSIIVPVYNTAEFLPAVFESLFSQTYEDLEMIVIDDGSTDNSADICREYAKKDLRIKFFRTENRGVSAARNFGIEAAGGDFIMFLDSDDTYTSDAVEKLVAAAEEYDADIVSAGIVRTDGKNEHIQKCTVFSGEVEGDELYSVLGEAFLGKDAALCSFIDKLYRADFLKERNIAFPALRSGEDTVFALEAMICASKMYFLNNHFFYRYFANGDSFTQKKLSLEERIEYSNLFFAECEKLMGKYGLTFLESAFSGRCALAVYDFVMNAVGREDLSKKECLSAIDTVCKQTYYTGRINKEILKKHSFRVRFTARLAAAGKVYAMYLFASLLKTVKRLKKRV
ncbi:MAG: glycosyltransferase family 2 protein [Ruminococcaceae bacterium]|nr:glycosyltransferase family 2 protein [Oscillospiraceae bacterium]